MDALEARHDKKATAALAKHETAAEKAAKKGRPAPDRPNLSRPVLPPQPTTAGKAFEEHRYSRKAARVKRRMLKREGNLEVRFEKADARYLRKVRRKVRRLANKLDDPDFVSEHPLLRPDPATGDTP